MTLDGWTVFNSTDSNWTNTILYTTGTTTFDNAATWTPPPVKSAVVTVALKDPMAWLRARVDEVCDLGRLDA